MPEPSTPDPAPTSPRHTATRASSVAPQALAMVLASGVGALAAFGLGSTSAWIALPLAGATIPLWPRLARTLGRQASGAASTPVGEWSARRLPAQIRWAILLGALAALVILLGVTVTSERPTLAHLLGIVAALGVAIGAWAWQFCAPGSLGRRVGTCAVGWAVGLSGNWVASATDCSNTTALVTRVSDAAFAGARLGGREGGREGAQQGVRDALADADVQEQLATRIAARIIAVSAPSGGGADDPRPMGAVVVSAVLRAQAAAQGGDAAAADALTQAESTGRTEGLLAFLGREAEQSPASRDEDLVQMHRELAAIADLAGDWRAALASYEQVLLRRPRDADSLTRTGDLLMGAGGRTAEARAMFERARDAAATPEEQFWALLGLGRVAERIQTLADANRSYTLAFQIASRMSERAPSDSTWKRNLSVALGKVGAAQAEQGQGEKAVASLRASLAIRAELAAADPESTTLMRDLSIGHAALGRVLTERGDLDGAIESIEASRVIRERLVELDGANAPAKRELASVLQDLGNVRENGGEFGAALAWYRQAAGILRTLRAVDPENLDWARDLSIAHNNIADVLLLMGDAAQSLASAEEAMAIARMLVARDEGNTQWQRDLAMCHYRIGDARMSLEEIPGALESFGAGLAIVERLATGDSANMSWKRDVYVGRGRVGDAKSRQDLPGAVASYQSALEVAEAMSAADPGNPEYQRDRATSLRKIGLALGALADFENALRSTETERAIRAALLERDRANVKWKRDLGLCEHTLGLILIDLGRLDEARVHAREATRILAEVSAAAPDNAERRADAADAAAVLERLGGG